MASRVCSDAEQTPRARSALSLHARRGSSESVGERILLTFIFTLIRKNACNVGLITGSVAFSWCLLCGEMNTVFLLQANLPLLQRELLHCARAAKQTPAQYLSQHEHLLLSTSVPSPADSTELLLEPNESSRRHSPNRYEHSHKIPRQYYSKVMVSDNGYSYATFSPYSAIQYKTYFLLLKIKLQ